VYTYVLTSFVDPLTPKLQSKSWFPFIFEWTV
jgi:hypothetical protein